MYSVQRKPPRILFHRPGSTTPYWPHGWQLHRPLRHLARPEERHWGRCSTWISCQLTPRPMPVPSALATASLAAKRLASNRLAILLWRYSSRSVGVRIRFTKTLTLSADNRVNASNFQNVCSPVLSRYRPEQFPALQRGDLPGDWLIPAA